MYNLKINNCIRFVWLTFILTTLIVFLLSLNSKVFSQSVDDFIIESFDATYYLTRDDKNIGLLEVEENIKTNFINRNVNHGILRAIPEKYADEDLNLKILSVTDDKGRPINYSTYRENQNLVLKIGNPDTYVYGKKDYKIKYSMSNVIRFYDEHDELFWNVNGVNWRQPIKNISATIKIDPVVNQARKSEVRCYTGAFGSKESNCNIVGVNQDYSEINISANNLGRGENLSFVLGFNKGTFSPDLQAKAIKKAILYSSILLAVLVPLIVLSFMLLTWKKNGRDESGLSTIVPQYEPPAELNPIFAKTLIDDQFDTKSLTANIIQLAINRVININVIQIDNDKNPEFEIEVNDLNAANNLSEMEKELLKSFFGENSQVGHKVELKSLKNKLYTHITNFRKITFRYLTDNEYYRRNPDDLKGKFIILGVFIMAFGFFSIFTINISDLLRPLLVALTFILFSSGIIVLVVSRYLPAKTNKGVDAIAYLLGLKEYIKLAEADRIKFHQSPDAAIKYGDYKDNKTKVKIYEQLLPYAIIFGLEKDWSQQFSDIYKSPPDWYRDSNSSFNSLYLANSISSLSDASTSSFSAPASSSSSGFSGGGSGGGGGGGGGGGW